MTISNFLCLEKGMSYNPGTPATPGYGIPPTPGPMYGDQPPATPGPIYGNSGASFRFQFILLTPLINFPSYAPATPGPQISYGHTPGPASNMRGPPSNAVGSVKRMNVADQQPQSVQSEYPPATPRSALDNGVQSPQIQNIGNIFRHSRNFKRNFSCNCGSRLRKIRLEKHRDASSKCRIQSQTICGGHYAN